MSRNQLVSKPPEREIMTTDKNKKLTVYFQSRTNRKDCISKHQERLRQRIYDKLTVRSFLGIWLAATVLSWLAVAVSPSHAQPTLVDPARYTLELFTQFPTDNVSIGKSGPFHLSFDADGNLFVGVEAGNNQATDQVRIRKVSPAGSVSTFGPPLLDPDGVLVDIDGLFSTPGSVLVSRLLPGTPPGAEITVIRPDGTTSALLQRTPATEELVNPQQMAFDSSGRLFVANCNSGTGTGPAGSVSVIDPATSPLTPDIIYDETASGSSSCVGGIAISSGDRVFASVFSAGKAIEISESGPARTIITGLNQPDAMAYDESGIFGGGKPLFFTERGAGRVTHVNPDTGESEVLATGFGSNFGPLGLAFGPDYCLYIAQHDRVVQGNNRIWRVCYADGDGVPNNTDNCPFNANADQADADDDGQGDACDTDDDNDSVVDASDNCPLTPNPDQADNELDALGDVCDSDDDNDGVNDASDNCPFSANADQADADGDGQGDTCDGDSDGDGVANTADNCPLAPNTDQTDTDGDRTGDACDLDDDGDEVADLEDNCPSTANPTQADLDGDNIGDACDADRDGDGRDDTEDNCPLEPNPGQDDADGDGVGDACDSDDDDDGVNDGSDNCPFLANPNQSDTDNDGQGDVCDGDGDGDGVPNAGDNCPLDANPDQHDFDGDGKGDACDDDTDGDGVLNDPDLCGRTPVDEVADPVIGCSIAQLCPCEGPRGTTERWKNHGQYVSCVARSTESFVELDLITEAEKDATVSTAAQSSCGNKK
jgi:hypothetical protein